ncbi:MAG: carboxymuconolactone decarboxylase family protein [Thermoplasmatales archaeon]|jgi:alkylhydroperoxidase/carboxymuconolactone decarboxylase family protein YurZ|nr:carboxymuconolactone decarboxylase family protein [Candidatus Thermoplasmatota archaeon]MDA8055697.1 carboxymuconolactone decarboxylase family protein [Thermoplasmatales archaeon]
MEKSKGHVNAELMDETRISNLLFKYNEHLAQEQMREKSALYLGRKNLSPKELSLVAISVSLAMGDRDSAYIHFREARRVKVSRTEILDVIKVTKLILMASSMSSFKTCLPIMQEKSRLSYNRKEVDRIVGRLKKELNLGLVPESLDVLSQFSFELFTEHLREKTELLTPMKLGMKFIYLIAFSVALTLGLGDCTRVYLSLFFEDEGKMVEVEDAIAIARFVIGNRAIVSAIEILKNMDSLPL